MFIKSLSIRPESLRMGWSTLDCIGRIKWPHFPRCYAFEKGNKHPVTPIRCGGHYGPTHLTAASRQCRLSASSGLPRIVGHSARKEAKRHPAPSTSRLFTTALGSFCKPTFEQIPHEPLRVTKQSYGMAKAHRERTVWLLYAP